ncbi:hypothetical protein OAT67_06785, partial [Bacteriovoracaceae bacterium]|nr:hypothetical protein [Bacteriovoracaceae bacterium]
LFPRSVGSRNLKDDLNRMYCHDFRDIDYRTKDQVPKILKMIKQISFDEQNLLRGHFISLMSGFPDLMIQMENFSDGKEVLAQSYTHSWNQWAEGENSKLNKNIFFEEVLTVEKVDRGIYFNRYQPKFGVNLDVNLGELDGTNQKVGKLKTTFHLTISKKFLSWAIRNWKGKDLSDKDVVEKVMKPFRVIVKDDIDRNWTKLGLTKSNDNLNELIINELLTQVTMYEGKFFKDEKGVLKIPIDVNFGTFALKYLRFQYFVKQNEGAREEKLAKLRDLRN